MNICRVCMDQDGDDLTPIFSKLEDAFIANIIVECTSIQILEDDGLPTVICGTCVDALKYFIGFIKKARESDRKLRKIFKPESSAVGGGAGKGKDGEEGQDWIPELQLAVFADDMVEVKAELDSDGEALTAEVIHDDGDDDGENDSDWKEQESEEEKPKRRRGRRKKSESESEDVSSEEEAPVKRTKRGRKKSTPAEFEEDSDGEDILDEKELATYDVIDKGESSVICCACYLIFDSEKEVKEHGETVHSKKRIVNARKTFVCKICFRRYSTAYALRMHQRKTKEANKVYACTKCSARFLTADRWRRRSHAHNHPRDKEASASKVIVAQIPATVHEEYGRICCAQACYQSFATDELLIAHAHTAHKVNKVEQSLDNKDKPVECPVCFKRFNDEVALSRHQTRNYKPLSHQCSVCGLKVRGGEALATHERSHRNEKPFECVQCRKNFSSKGSLKAHMMVHSGEKPFVCSICGWGFRRKRNLQVHVLSHSDNQPFQCEVCQKTFKAKIHLQYHMRTHTGEKPYPCRYCDKAFADHTNRQRHEMSHTGIKPYKCSYCDKTFIRKRFQVDHESSHTGVKPYRCEMCNRTFSQKSALRRHLDSHPLAPENAVALAAPSPMPPLSHHASTDGSMSSPPPPPALIMGEAGPSAINYFQHPRNLSLHHV